VTKKKEWPTDLKGSNILEQPQSPLSENSSSSGTPK
jgi:hypothetical protein